MDKKRLERVFKQMAIASKRKRKGKFWTPEKNKWVVVVTILGIFGCLPAPRTGIPCTPPLVHDIRPASGVAVRTLSDYLPDLSRTPGDTGIYIIEGTEPGGTAFLTGGTHANEVAGSMTAVLLAERAKLQKGQFIVIPYANNSAITYPDPRRSSSPRHFEILTDSGLRTFRIGARWTHPDHQGEPDPPNDRLPSPEYKWDSVSRNLDRQFPGNPQGNLTQKIAYAIMNLIRKESVDLAFDLHEAGPESRLAMMIVANPKNVDLAAEAVLNLEVEGLGMKLEESSKDFRGLSHREWGDATPAKAFLIETPNPALRREFPGDPVSDPEWPLSRRVGIHLDSIRAVIEAYNGSVPRDKNIILSNLPSRKDLAKFGIGKFLR